MGEVGHGDDFPASPLMDTALEAAKSLKFWPGSWLRPEVILWSSGEHWVWYTSEPAEAMVPATVGTTSVF